MEATTIFVVLLAAELVACSEIEYSDTTVAKVGEIFGTSSHAAKKDLNMWKYQMQQEQENELGYEFIL